MRLNLISFLIFLLVMMKTRLCVQLDTAFKWSPRKNLEKRSLLLSLWKMCRGLCCLYQHTLAGLIYVFFLCSDSRAELCMLHVIYFYLFLIASAFFRFSAHNFMHCTGFLRFPNKLRALICIQNSVNKNENWLISFSCLIFIVVRAHVLAWIHTITEIGLHALAVTGY